jgi:hypothetical protein
MFYYTQYCKAVLSLNAAAVSALSFWGTLGFIARSMPWNNKSQNMEILIR